MTLRCGKNICTQ